MAKRAQSSGKVAGNTPPRGRPFRKGGDVRRNPGGRPKGFATAVREVVGDNPTELAKLALSIARAEPQLGDLTRQPRKGEDVKQVPRRWIVPNMIARKEALEFLRDTGWGKPVQAVSVGANGGGGGVVVMLPPEDPGK